MELIRKGKTSNPPASMCDCRMVCATKCMYPEKNHSIFNQNGIQNWTDAFGHKLRIQKKPCILDSIQSVKYEVRLKVSSKLTDIFLVWSWLVLLFEPLKLTKTFSCLPPASNLNLLLLLSSKLSKHKWSGCETSTYWLLVVYFIRLEYHY